MTGILTDPNHRPLGAVFDGYSRQYGRNRLDSANAQPGREAGARGGGTGNPNRSSGDFSDSGHYQHWDSVETLGESDWILYASELVQRQFVLKVFRTV